MKRYTLTQKIILIFLVVMIPVTLLLFFSTDYSKKKIRQEVSQSNNNLLIMYMDKIDADLESIDTYLYKMISSNAHIFTDDYKSTDYASYVWSLVSIKEQLREDLYLYPFVDTFFVYDIKNNKVIETSNIIPGNLLAENTLGKLVVDKGAVPWSIIHKGDNILLTRMIKFNDTLYMGAYFRIDNIMPRNMNFNEGALVGIKDESGNLLAGDSYIQELLSLGTKNNNKEGFEVVSDKEFSTFLVTSATSKYSPLTLTLAYLEEEMLSSLYKLQRIQYIAPILIVLTLLIYIYLLKSALIKPINILEKAMKSIGIGKWETRIQENWKQEFSNIEKGFNEMADHIHSLKIAMYDEQLKVQKGEYRYLQMQINPHFYMNTINVIYNMAALKDYEHIQELSIYLANHFRYIMKSSQQLMHLNDEIEHTKNYLEIHRVRFGENLGYSIQVLPPNNTYYIASLTIQTFVENSIIHGFVVRNKPFDISIDIKPSTIKSEPFYEVIIQDTGVGFPEDFLKCFRERNFSGKYENCIGIQNTLKRLELIYKGTASVELENGKEGGAVVKLLLPSGKEV